ncbi:MAG TPA: hypothetical protein PKJ63_00455 [Cyclobacteriaceae bacterium]|nr:hypothetical protein [Cyclobacteriaceae bacterium]
MMTSTKVSRTNETPMSINSKEKQLGICPDCLERELVRSVHMESDEAKGMKKSMMYTCRNCGYQDERF